MDVDSEHLHSLSPLVLDVVMWFSNGQIIFLYNRCRHHETLPYTACASELNSSPSPTLKSMYLYKLLVDENVFYFPQKEQNVKNHIHCILHM